MITKVLFRNAIAFLTHIVKKPHGQLNSCYFHGFWLSVSSNGNGDCVLFFKSDAEQEFKVGKRGLLVALPIVILMAIAFIYAAVHR